MKELMMKKCYSALAAFALLSGNMALAAPGKNVEILEKGKGYSFEYGYPVVIRQFPELEQNLLSEKDTHLSELKKWGAEWASENPDRASETDMQLQINWLTVAHLPRFLSLTIDEWSYTGGAHGNWGRGSMIWDKKTATKLVPTALFSSKDALDRLVQKPFCDLLDIERSKKRDGEKVDRSQSEDWMQACPKPSELTVILGSSNGKTFNRLAVYAAPYAAGPYVEGDYEIDLPITAQLVAIVKPQYRAAFSPTPVSKKR
jgi:hypothetical protein